MSKLAKRPFAIPKELEVKTVSDGKLSISNKSHEIILPFESELISVSVDNTKKEVLFSKKDETKQSISYVGTIARIFQTHIKSLQQKNGCTVNLVIKGVGYKAVVSGNLLILTLGYSHNIAVEIPDGIKITVDKNVNVAVSAFDKQYLMNFVKSLQKLRKKNPYKGTGIHIDGEFVLRKEVKKSKK